MVNDQKKTKQQLIEELAELRQRIAEPEAIAARREEVQEAPRENEERLHLILESIPSFLVETDLGGRILSLNRTQPGYSLEDFVGKSVDEIVHPKGQEIWRKSFDEVIEKGVSVVYEAEDYGPRETRAWYLHKLAPVFREGQVESVIMVVDDITERKQAEKAVIELSKQNEMILAAAGEGIYGLDLEGKTTFVNPAAAKLIGWEPDDLIGLSQHSVLHHSHSDGTPYDRDKCPIYAAFRDGRIHHVDDEVFWRKDGSSFPVEYISTPIRDGEGTVVGAVVTFRDITERRQAEERLRFLSSITEQVSESVVVTDADYRITYVNQAMESLYGYSADEVIGQTPVIMNAEPMADSIQAGVYATVSAGGTFQGAALNKRKDGSTFDCEFKVSPVYDAGGQITRHIGIQRDVTDRKRMEEQLRQSQLLASLGEMTAGIAHEVNNPLAAILLYSELINRQTLPPAVRKDLKVIRGEAKRASDIMKNLLAYARKAAPVTQRMDIHKTLRRVVNMRQYQERVRNIDIDVKMADGPLRVRGNAAQLTQVFMNLIVNAEEAVEDPDDKRIVVSTETYSQTARITVADSGGGIPEENLTQVFVPFFSTKSIGKGTGLGLATCHGIVTAHGGSIRAENNDMGGATFIVELPLVK